MASSFLTVLRTTLLPSGRKSAKAAEATKAQLFSQRLTDVLGQLAERERQLLQNSQQRLVEN